MRRREVLELVDEQHSGEALAPQAEGRIAEQTLDGAGDLLVEVDDALIGELSPVVTGDAVEIGDVRKLVLDG